MIKRLCMALCLGGALPAWAFESFVVSDIRIEGLQRVELGTVHSYLPIKVGEELSEQDVPDVIRALYRTGSFEQVEVSKQDNVLVIKVLERPTITSIYFTGNRDIKTEALLEALKANGIAKGEVFNPAVISQVEQDLEQQYFAHGKYAVRIKSIVTPLPRNRIDVKFVITEGQAAKIKQINIVGNHVFKDEELLGKFELNTGSWLSVFTDSDQYAKEKLAGDLETLRAYYLNRGYLKFQISSTQVSLSPDKKSVYITIHVNEGDRYTVREIELAGRLLVPESDLRALIPIKSGDVYSGEQVSFAEQAIAKRLGNDGYAFARIETTPEVDEKTHQVKLAMLIDPGKRAYIRRIQFAGNVATDDHVLRREMRILEGGLLSSAEVERSKTRLERLPYIEKVEIETPMVEGTDDLADVQFKVVERPSGEITGAVGFSQAQGVILSAGVKQDSFLGTGNRVAFEISHSKAINIYDVSYLNPYYTAEGVSRGFRVFYRETDFRELNRSNENINSFGGSVNYGIPLNEYTHLSFNAGYRNTEIEINNSVLQPQHIVDFYKSLGKDLKFDSKLKFDVFTLGGVWSKSTLNRGYFPDKGTSHEVSTEATVPGSKLQYYKLDYELNHYMPIRSGWSLLFRGQASYGNGYGKDELGNRATLPHFENFFGGGPDSLRGFDFSTVGPHEIFRRTTFLKPTPDGGAVPLPPEFDTIEIGRNGVGGNARLLGSMELIFPTPFAKEYRSVRTSAFIDVGNVWDTRFDRNRFSDLKAAEFAKIPDFKQINTFRASAGLAVQWISPIGAMVVSVAAPLKKQDNDSTQVFQFTLGKTY